MKHLVLIIALAAFSTPAFAEGAYQEENELRLVQGVYVFVGDEEEGCLPNLNALKVEAELILRRSGIRVLVSGEETQGIPAASSFVLLFEFLSEELPVTDRPTGSCVASMSVELYRLAKVPEGHLGSITAYKEVTILVDYPKSEAQEILRTVVSEYVSDIANEILKARGN